jgi:inorganic pyrophosphatase/exopolyphosphatase
VSVGNKACDLDSMVAALTLSYHKSIVSLDEKCYFALIPIPIEEFRLRTEATYLFGEVDIGAGDLIDLDTFNSTIQNLPSTESILQIGPQIQIALVDHNLIEDYFPSFYSQYVVEIVDHHADLNGVYPLLKSKQIELVGSATTLIADMFLSDSKSRQCLASDSSLLKLLLGAILLDTVGLNEKMGKTFEKDKRVVNELHAIDPTINLDSFFQKIQSEKFNQSSLGTTELLIKDYKNFKAADIHYGMSSVLMSCEAWLAKGENLVEKFENFCQKKGLDVLFCLNMYEDSNGFHRELVVYQPLSTKCDVPLLVQKLLQEKKLLDLSPSQQVIEGGRVWCFDQSIITSSRKQIEPLVRSLLPETVSNK